jgi:hypothetical protein
MLGTTRVRKWHRTVKEKLYLHNQSSLPTIKGKVNKIKVFILMQILESSGGFPHCHISDMKGTIS